MNVRIDEKDYSAIKKGMKEHIAVTVQGGRWMSFAKLSTGKWAAVKGNGDLDDFEILPDDLFTMLCIFHDSGRRVIFRGHSAV